MTPLQVACADAQAAFDRGILDADALVLLAMVDSTYRRVLLRSAIVVAMAVWQAYVERLARNLVRALGPARPPDATSTADELMEAFSMVHELAVRAVDAKCDSLNTPNTAKVDDLFGSLRYNADWSIRNRAGDLVATHELARGKLNGFLRVRHAIAHGGSVEAKQSVVRLVALGGDPDPVHNDLADVLTLLKDLTRSLTEGAAARFAPAAMAPDEQGEGTSVAALADQAAGSSR